MKRNILFAAGLLLAGQTTALTAAAEEAAGQPKIVEIPVEETMPDLEGENVIIKTPVSVTDVDGDGLLTVNDALDLAGDAIRAPSDTSNVYVYVVPDLNGVLGGLGQKGTERITDRASAYIYKEASYFDRSSLTVDPGMAFTLTLRHTGFDADRNLVTTPVANAVITIDGAESGFVTDDEGKVTVTLDKPGTAVLSAVTDIEQCVPPTAKVFVMGELEPVTEPTAAPTEPASTPAVPTEPPPGDDAPVSPDPGSAPETPSEAPPPEAPDLDSPPTGERGARGLAAAACASLLAAAAMAGRRRRAGAKKNEKSGKQIYTDRRLSKKCL